MRILAIYRHYWPDATPYSRLLRAILEEQVTQGHRATVFSAQPCYNDVVFPRQASHEILGGVDIRRIDLLPERKRVRFLRVVNYVYFLLRAVLHVLRFQKYDLIVTNSHPPVLMGMALRIIKRLTGISYLIHCQDVHPESALLAGQLNGALLAPFCLKSDIKSCREAIRVVTLSTDMKQTLQERNNYNAENVVVINNFALDRYGSAPVLPQVFREVDERKFRVLFAGNMGLFQDLSRLLKSIRLLGEEFPMQFIFMGAGAETAKLAAMAADLKGTQVVFEPYQPVEVAFACMQRANLGVVSLLDGVSRLAYPSKTMTYLAAGCPVLLIAERKSQMSTEILANALGYVPKSTSEIEIAAAIRVAWNDRLRWTPTARQQLIERAEALYGKKNALREWNKLFQELANEIGCDSVPVSTQRECLPNRAA